MVSPCSEIGEFWVLFWSVTIMKKEGEDPPPLGRGSRQAVPTLWWLLLCLLVGPAQGTPRRPQASPPSTHVRSLTEGPVVEQSSLRF